MRSHGVASFVWEIRIWPANGTTTSLDCETQYNTRDTSAYSIDREAQELHNDHAT